MESQDIWLEVELNIKVNERLFVSTFGIKIDQQTSGIELKKIIQKIAIQIWNQMAADQNLMNQNKNSLKQTQQSFIVKTLQNEAIDFRTSPSIKQQKDNFDSTLSKPESTDYLLTQVAQLLGSDLFYVLTSICVQIYKRVSQQESESIKIQNSRQNKDQILAKNQYRALVAQERQLAGNKETCVAEDQNSTSEKRMNSQKKAKNVKMGVSELVKICDEDLVKDIFDYDRNKIKVDCSFQTIFQYFQDYLSQMHQCVMLVDSLPQVSNFIKSFQDQQFEQISNNQNLTNYQRDQFSQITSLKEKIIENSFSDESIGPTKKCNDEQMFIWNLANIDSAIIEKILIPNNQDTQKQFSAQDKSQQRSKYWAMLRNREIFHNLLRTGYNNNSNKRSFSINLNQTGNQENSGNSFNSKNELKQNIKSGIFERFFRQSTETTSKKNNRILPKISQAHEQKTDQLKSQNETADFNMNDLDQQNENLFKDRFSNQIEETHKDIYDSRQISKNIVPASFDYKNSKLSLSKSQSPENQIEEFDLMSYLDTYYNQSLQVKNQDLQLKRFMLQNKVHSSTLLQSKKEMNNNLLYYRHLLIKNAINLKDKKKNQTKGKNIQFFKALEVTNDQINPDFYFQINQNVNKEKNFTRSLVDAPEKFTFYQNQKSPVQKSVSFRQQNFQPAQIQERQSLISGFQQQLAKQSINILNLKQIREADEDQEQTIMMKNYMKNNKQEDKKQSVSSDSNEEGDFDSQGIDSRTSSMNQLQFNFKRNDNVSISESSDDEIINIYDNQKYDQSIKNQSIISDKYFDEQPVKKFSQESYMILKKDSAVLSQISQAQRKDTLITHHKSQVKSYSVSSGFSDTIMDVQDKLERHNSSIKFVNDFQPIKIEERELLDDKSYSRNISQSLRQKKQNDHESRYSQKTSKHKKQEIFDDIKSALDQNPSTARTFQMPNLLIPIQNFESEDRDPRKSLSVLRESENKDLLQNQQFDPTILETKESFKQAKEGIRSRITKLFSVFVDKKKNENAQDRNPTKDSKNMFKRYNSGKVDGNVDFADVPAQLSSRLKQNSNTQYLKQKSESPTKFRNNDLSISVSINLEKFCAQCGQLKPVQAVQCPSCKQKSTQPKSILQYFQKTSNLKSDDVPKMFSLANNLYDVGKVSNVSPALFQQVVNEKINNGANKSKFSNFEEHIMKIARDLVSKALILGSGGHLDELMELGEDLCKQLISQARILQGPKDVNKNNQLQQLLVLGYQMQLAKLLPLPEFVLTIEEFQAIREPPIVNLVYQEVKSGRANSNMKEIDRALEVKKRMGFTFALVGVICLVAIIIIILCIFL